VSNTELLKELRDQMKVKKISYAAIGRHAGLSGGWISTVLRGGYPYDGAGKLPKNIRLALEYYGFEIHSDLVTF
jgi:hypothetical protein